jgi:hypothetical protein
MAGLSLKYAPPGATLKAFRDSPAMARGLVGPMLGGRKTCAVHDILLSAVYGRQMRWRWAVVHPLEDGLRDHTIRVWHRWVSPTIGSWDARGLRHRVELEVNGKPRDLDVTFFALDVRDHRKRLMMFETTGIWLDGARDIEEDIFDKALDLAGQWPLDEGGANPKIIITSRMPLSTHWLARRPDLVLFRQPGGRTAQAENLTNIKDGFYQRAIVGRSADHVRTEIDAEFGLAATEAAETRQLRDEVLGRLSGLSAANALRIEQIREAAMAKAEAA